MAKGFPSHLRTARIVQELLAPELRRVVPGALITIQGVEVTADRHQAEVLYTVMGADPQPTHDLLEAHLGMLREVLAKGMHSKRVPQLTLRQLPSDALDLTCTVSC